MMADSTYQGFFETWLETIGLGRAQGVQPLHHQVQLLDSIPSAHSHQQSKGSSEPKHKARG